MFTQVHLLTEEISVKYSKYKRSKSHDPACQGEKLLFMYSESSLNIVVRVCDVKWNNIKETGFTTGQWI